MALRLPTNNETTSTSSIPPDLSATINSLERGCNVLGMLGAVKLPDDLSSTVKDTGKNLFTLIGRLKKMQGEDVADIGMFLESLFSSFMRGTISLQETVQAAWLVEGLINKIEEGSEEQKSSLENVGVDISQSITEAFLISNNLPLSVKDSTYKVDVMRESLITDFRKVNREKGLFDFMETKTGELFATLFSNRILGAQSKQETASVVEELDLDESKVVIVLEALDLSSLVAIHPLFPELDKVKGWDVTEKMKDKVLSASPNFYKDLNEIKLTLIRFPEALRNTFKLFLEIMYESTSGIYDDKEYSGEDAVKLVTELIGEKTLDSLRKEVHKRERLRSTLKSLSYENFNLCKAVKAFSSCLARCAIQQEITNEVALEALQILVFEKMQGLFEGKKEEPIKFIKSVFLIPK